VKRNYSFQQYGTATESSKPREDKNDTFKLQITLHRHRKAEDQWRSPSQTTSFFVITVPVSIFKMLPMVPACVYWERENVQDAASVNSIYNYKVVSTPFDEIVWVDVRMPQIHGFHELNFFWNRGRHRVRRIFYKEIERII